MASDSDVVDAVRARMAPIPKPIYDFLLGRMDAEG